MAALQTRQSAGQLARALDPGLFAAWLKIDLDAWQQELVRSRRRQIIILCTRQAGKSMATGLLALHRAVYNPEHKIIIVAPTERQAKKMLQAIKRLYRRQPMNERVGVTKWNVFSVELANGSTIEALPGKGDTIRGEPEVHLVIVDEASRIDEELLTAVRPMLSVTGGTLVMLSTPNGKRGTFYTTWTKEADHPDWHRIGPVTAWQVPRIDRAFLEEERRDLPGPLFSQEYECLFVEQIGAVFRDDLIQAAMSDRTITPLLPTSRPEPLFDPRVTPLLTGS